MNQKWAKESMDGERSTVDITRDYDFPREKVFNMFTDEKKAAKFWGPAGAEKLVFKFDARPGGAIRIVDRYDGKTANTTGTITEIVTPKIIAFRSATTPEGNTAPWEVLQTVTFEELTPLRTRVSIRVKILDTGPFPGGVEPLKEGYMGGWGETLDMLQKELR
jgi:uncharacterized protein YndB with AHSA1/START domain